MSKQIDITQPLSDEDKAWLEQMGRDDLIKRAEDIAAGKAEASSATAGVALSPHTSTADLLAGTENTGDVNTGLGERQVVHENSGSDLEQMAKNLEANYTKAELVAAAEKRDLDAGGNKSDLARRLAAHMVAAGEKLPGDDDEDDTNE